ncbi:transposase [Empedobacter brevis]
MKKRVYSTEFKSSAVGLSYERENIKELADELGIQVERIYKWRSSEKTFANPKPIISKKNRNRFFRSQTTSKSS